MTKVTLTRQPQLLPCLLVTIHGTRETGFHCALRGDQAEVADMLEKVLLVLQHAPALEIEPEPHLFTLKELRERSRRVREDLVLPPEESK
jgi:hypothetical protein